MTERDMADIAQHAESIQMALAKTGSHFCDITQTGGCRIYISSLERLQQLLPDQTLLRGFGPYDENGKQVLVLEKRLYGVVLWVPAPEEVAEEVLRELEGATP